MGDKFRGCDGKTKHTSLTSAQYVQSQLTFQPNAEIYECKVCGFLHIGTPSKKPKKKIKLKKGKKHEHSQHKNKRPLRRFKY